MNAIAITRPALRYLGGKWRLAPWIVKHFPPHRLYVEPFGGAASVLLRKAPSYAEVYNDLDGDVVNLFQVLRQPGPAARLVELVALTPFAREEFVASYELSADPVERARRLLVRSFMGHGANAANIARNTGWRGNTDRRSTTPSLDWSRYPEPLSAIAARFQSGVQIESRPALDVVAHYDRPDALIYADPPYMHETRSPRKNGNGLQCAYPVEMTDADHGSLLEALCRAKSMVVLSGYRTALYDFWLDGAGWRRVERPSFADGARPRVECLWLNPAAVAALGSEL